MNQISNDEKDIEDIFLLQRPVMQFLLQHHDLESLQVVMKQALRYILSIGFLF